MLIVNITDLRFPVSHCLGNSVTLVRIIICGSLIIDAIGRENEAKAQQAAMNLDQTQGVNTQLQDSTTRTVIYQNDAYENKIPSPNNYEGSKNLENTFCTQCDHY